MREASDGFLEELYHGNVQRKRLDTPGGTIDEEKVSSFVDQYNEIIKRFDPASLEKEGTLPQELLGKLKKLGMFGLTISEEYGGLGFTLSEYLRVVEAMAKSDMALVLVPLAHLSIGVKGIVLFGSEEQKKTYLPPAASGEMVFCYALTEPKVGSDAKHIESAARLSEDGTHYILNGSKTYITNGNYAGGMTVFAQLDPEKEPGRMGAFIVERKWAGVTVGKDMPKMGLKVSSTTPIRLKDVRVPVENLIGEPGDGFKIAMNILNYGRLGLGAASAGLMNQSLKDMAKRGESRKQFGVPIRDFQLIQEKMVKAKAHAAAARNMTFFTAGLLEEDPLMNVAIESSHCKLYGTTRCWDTLYDALQTAGGAGYISTLPYEKRMRDFRVTTIFEGTSEIHSIYPPLTLFRTEGKKVNGLSSPIAKLLALWRLSRPAGLGKATTGTALLNRAIRTAGTSEAIFKRLLARGMWKFGKKVVGKGYFLRRMTETSISLFQLIATVSVLQDTYGTEIPESELAVLEYLIEESRLVQKSTSGKLTRSIERVSDQVMKGIGGE